MAENDQNPAAAGENQASQPQFALQRIYVKDISYESPKSPMIFRETWRPQVNMELNTRHERIQDIPDNNLYEVVLSLTITAKNGEGEDAETAYLVEIHQAGVFLVDGLDDNQLQQTLGSFCPNILFPYAREAVDSLVVRGSFPGLMLSPVNFDALYAETQRRRQEQEANATQN